MRLSFYCFVLLMLTALFAAGCGRPATQEDFRDNDRVPADHVRTDSDSDDFSGNDEAVPVTIREDADGRQYLGNVPLDVFFDDPLEVASDNTPVDTAAAVADRGESTPHEASQTVAEASDRDARTNASDAPSSDSLSSEWATVLPAEYLDAEIKAVRNFLNGKLQSVGTYNASVTMIPPQAAVLAVLAAIAEEHPGRISWKDDAGYVRDLAARMTATPLQRGPKDQRRLLGLFESISDTLNRSRPAGLDPPQDASFADVAEMRLVMMRLEAAQNYLRTEIGESGFQSESDRVRHEASILGGLMKAMMTESYGYSDDPEFLKHANGIVESAAGIRESVESGDFAAFELNLSRTGTTCQACHRDYKNN